VHLAASVSPATLQVADLNGDGKPDLVIGLGGFGSAVAVFMNISLPQLTNVNAASSLAGPLAPNSWVSAYGTGLATASQGASTLNQTNVGGTTVTVTDASGAQRLAPLSYVSPGQVNYLVPNGTALGAATVTVSVGGTAVASGGSLSLPSGRGCSCTREPIWWPATCFGSTRQLAIHREQLRGHFERRAGSLSDRPRPGHRPGVPGVVRHRPARSQRRIQ